MTDHPHTACEKCKSCFNFNSSLQWVCMLAIPFVSGERAIALAVIVLVGEIGLLAARWDGGK